MDEEEIELFKEQIAKSDRVASYIMDISGSLLKVMPNVASAEVSNKILPIYQKALIDVTRQDNDAALLDSLCLLCDCLEFGSDDLFNAIAKPGAQKLLEVIKA